MNRSIIYLLQHRRRTESGEVTPSRQTIWQNLCQAKWWSDLVPRWAVHTHTHTHTHSAVSAPPNSEQSHLGLNRVCVCVCVCVCIMVPKLSSTGNMLRSNHPLRPAVNESLDPSHTHFSRATVEVSALRTTIDTHKPHKYIKSHTCDISVSDSSALKCFAGHHASAPWRNGKYWHVKRSSPQHNDFTVLALTLLLGGHRILF